MYGCVVVHSFYNTDLIYVLFNWTRVNSLFKVKQNIGTLILKQLSEYRFVNSAFGFLLRLLFTHFATHSMFVWASFANEMQRKVKHFI